MSQIVPSAQVTLEAQHNQLGSANLDEHWRSPLWWAGAGNWNREVKGWLRSYESNLPSLYIDAIKRKNY